MLLFYVRHGDPIYNPDSLTPKGQLEAEAVAKRLALFGIDKIYSSTSNRAILTALPTCNLTTKKEPITMEFCHENLAYKDFGITSEYGHRAWVCNIPKYKKLFESSEIRKLDKEWYNHPELAQFSFKDGCERVAKGTFDFIASLGYEHVEGENLYKCITPNNDRVALFAHEGFGLLFLSTLLDIPYPMFSTHFAFRTTGMTVIEFKDEGGFAVPKILTHSSDSHLYKEGLPTLYNGSIRF